MECPREAVHGLSGLGKALGEGQRMTRLRTAGLALGSVTLVPWQNQGHPDFKWETHVREFLYLLPPGPSFRMRRAKALCTERSRVLLQLRLAEGYVSLEEPMRSSAAPLVFDLRGAEPAS